MYSFSSTSQILAPSARLAKNAWPPTLRKARTGELTPPGMYLSALRNNSDEREVIYSKAKVQRPTSNVQRSIIRANPRSCRYVDTVYQRASLIARAMAG